MASRLIGRYPDCGYDCCPAAAEVFVQIRPIRAIWGAEKGAEDLAGHWAEGA